MDYNNVDAYNDEGDYVLNRALLYHDRRDFIIQPGDTGKREDYPVNPPARRSRQLRSEEETTNKALILRLQGRLEEGAR